MSKILISGGAGFIGSHITDKLIDKGHRVVVLDNLSTGKKENVNEKAELKELDICDFEAIRPLFDGVDFVFHLAALPRVPISVKDPIGTSQINIMGTINVFKASAEAKVKRVMFASSSSVYGNDNKPPFKEDMWPMPVSPYALQKRVGEEFAQLFTELYKTPIVILRFFTSFGPRMIFDSEYSLAIGKFFKLKRDNKPLTIFGDGEQTRGFCYVMDIAEGNIKAMESDKLKGGEIINLAGAEIVSINQLADLMGGEKVYLPPREGDVRFSMGDASKAKELIDWQPRFSFKQALEETKEWFEKINNQ
ncbi:MAG: NAD-dependent epimerase/dehydratase family protein [Parcubacteria group bacterium]|nr:NAD-dependent epimerase/dehydratase family protein [Parcubacteria group bacterium]